jgi:hypothetical protein
MQHWTDSAEQRGDYAEIVLLICLCTERVQLVLEIYIKVNVKEI